jgi:hypothetical protein
LIAWPGSIADTSISVVLSASTSFDGAIWLISGSRTTAPPTPAALIAATLMKSRRRNSPVAVSTCVSVVAAVSAIRALPVSSRFARPADAGRIAPPAQSANCLRGHPSKRSIRATHAKGAPRPDIAG